MATVYEALVQLKAVLLSASAAEQPVLEAGYVYPNDYATMPSPFSLPCIVVKEMVNEPNSWERKADGLWVHKWRAEIILFAALGPLQAINAESAAAELTTENWATAFADRLWLNRSLNGTAQILGEAAGETRKFFEYRIGHVNWETAVYWGIRFELPVSQLHEGRSG